MSSICWVVKNCAGIRRNLPGPARCFRCVFQGSSADGLVGIAPCFHRAHQRRSPELNCCNLPPSLRSFFLRSSFSRPASRGKHRIAGSPGLRSFRFRPGWSPEKLGNSLTGCERTALSSNTGLFRFTNLPFGSYRLPVNAESFESN